LVVASHFLAGSALPLILAKGLRGNNIPVLTPADVRRLVVVLISVMIVPHA
jgi:hypothetical protein